MRTQLLEERFQFSGGKVRRPGIDGFTGTYPIIEGVLLCGAVSANKRDYLAAAFAGDRITRYHDKSVFLNHGKGRDPRDFRDKIAWVENEHHNAQGLPVGNLGVNPKHPDAETLLWAAEHKPSYCGMSHVAHCRTTTKNGREIVEEIIGVESVDIVVDPATTKGFFEQTERTDMPQITVKALAEWVAKHPKGTSTQALTVKVFAEDATYADKLIEGPDDSAEPTVAINAMFSTLMHAHLDEMISGTQTVEDFVKRVKALHKAKIGESKESASAPEPGKEIGYERAMVLCSEAKYTASATEYRLLAKCLSDADAKSFIAEQSAKSTATPPRSSGRTVTPAPKPGAKQESRLIPAW